MSDKPWKAHERRSAALIHGKRFPANQGGKADVASDRYLGSCKEVATMPLAELTRLMVEIETEAKKVGKRGVLFIKLRAGKGYPTPTLCIMNAETWTQRCGLCGGPAISGAVCGACAEKR